MFKVLISTEGFGVFPKQGEEFRVGPITGICAEHYINDKGYCTHVVMDDVRYCTHFIDMDEREQRACCHDFGVVVECPIVKGKFCNIQFEDGSHCECCKPKLDYINREYVLVERKWKCPIFEDDRIGTCWVGSEIEETYLKDNCRKCMEKANEALGWNIEIKF